MSTGIISVGLLLVASIEADVLGKVRRRLPQRCYFAYRRLRSGYSKSWFRLVFVSSSQILGYCSVQFALLIARLARGRNVELRRPLNVMPLPQYLKATSIRMTTHHYSHYHHTNRICPSKNCWRFYRAP